MSFWQVVVNLYSAALNVSRSFDFTGSVPSEIIKQKSLVTKYAYEEATGEEVPSICSCTLFLVEGILKIKHVDVILQKTRIINDMDSSIKPFDALSSNAFAELDLPDCGILISIQQASVDLSFEEERLEVLTDFLEIQSVIFGYQNQKGKNTYQSVFRDLLLQSCNCLYEISVSNCKFSLSLFLSQSASSSRNMHSELGSASGSNRSYVDNFSFSIDSERSSSQSSNRSQKLRFASTISAPDPSHWLFLNVELGILYVGSCSQKNALFGSHDLTKLWSSLSVGGEFQTISWGIQVIYIYIYIIIIIIICCCCSSLGFI